MFIACTYDNCTNFINSANVINFFYIVALISQFRKLKVTFGGLCFKNNRQGTQEAKPTVSFPRPFNCDKEKFTPSSYISVSDLPTWSLYCLHLRGVIFYHVKIWSEYFCGI